MGCRENLPAHAVIRGMDERIRAIAGASFAVAILTFMGSWNDFFGPLLYLTDPNLWTVQIGLLQFQSGVPGENAQEIWAATALITLPLVIVYFFLQDQFVQAFANVKFK